MLLCFSFILTFRLTCLGNEQPSDAAGIRVDAGLAYGDHEVGELRSIEGSGGHQNRTASAQAGYAIHHGTVYDARHVSDDNVEFVSEVLHAIIAERRLKRDASTLLTAADLESLASSLTVTAPEDYFVITVLLVDLTVDVSTRAFSEDMRTKLQAALQSAANATLSSASAQVPTALPAAAALLDSRAISGNDTQQAFGGEIQTSADNATLAPEPAASQSDGSSAMTPAAAAATQAQSVADVTGADTAAGLLGAAVTGAPGNAPQPTSAGNLGPGGLSDSQSFQPRMPFTVVVSFVIRIPSNISSTRVRRQAVASQSASRVALVYYVLQAGKVVSPQALAAFVSAALSVRSASAVLGYPVDILIQPYPAANNGEGGVTKTMAIDSCWILATVATILALILLLVVFVMCCKKCDEEKKRRKREALGQPINVKTVMEKDRLILENVELRRQLKASEDAINQLRLQMQSYKPTAAARTLNSTESSTIVPAPTASSDVLDTKQSTPLPEKSSLAPPAPRMVNPGAALRSPAPNRGTNLPTIVVASPNQNQVPSSAGRLAQTSPATGQTNVWPSASSVRRAANYQAAPNDGRSLKTFRSIGIDSTPERMSVAVNTVRFDLTVPPSAEVSQEFEKEPLFSHVGLTYEEHDIDLVLTPSAVELAVEEYTSKGETIATQTSPSGESSQQLPGTATTIATATAATATVATATATVATAATPATAAIINRAAEVRRDQETAQPQVQGQVPAPAPAGKGHSEGVMQQPARELASVREAVKSFLMDTVPTLRALGLEVVAQNPDIGVSNVSALLSIPAAGAVKSSPQKPPPPPPPESSRSTVATSSATPAARSVGDQACQQDGVAKPAKDAIGPWTASEKAGVAGEAVPNVGGDVAAQGSASPRSSKMLKDVLKKLLTPIQYRKAMAKKEIINMCKKGFSAITAARVHSIPVEDVYYMLTDAYADGLHIDPRHLLAQMNANMESVIAVRNYLLHHQVGCLDDVREHLPKHLQLTAAVIRLAVAMMLNNAI